MFSHIKKFGTLRQHLRPQIISLMNIKNQPNGKKRNHFPCCSFRMDFVAFQILISYIIQSNTLCEHCQTYMYALFIHESKLKSIVLVNTILLILLSWKLQLKQGFKLFKKIQKDIYIISNLFLIFFIKLTWHHSTYSYILILYNHEIINVIKIQNNPLRSFFS